ncbi:putative RNA-directed DNA polymerase from transposon X-element [Trichonephila clavipes]|nr:putative RNA-directed DNA polymerase from transposon X-element [Trichonephila clavipes]
MRIKPPSNLKKNTEKITSVKIAREQDSPNETSPVSKKSRRRKTFKASDAMDTDANPSDTDYVTDTEGPSVSGGVCIFTSLDVPSSALPLHTSLQAVAVRIHSTSLITVCCLYLPPNTVIHQHDLNNLVDQLPAPFIILGDFNGHNTLWGSAKTNSRGRQIEQVLSDHCLCLLNHEEPTYFHEPTRSFHTIDLVICSPSLLSHLNLSVEKDLYNSDHFRVILSHDSDPGGKTFPHTYSYRRADWALFTQLAVITDAMVKTESIDTAVQEVTNVLIAAADLSIPKSSSHSFQHYKPWWNADCQTAYKNQRKLWGIFRRYPTTENLLALQKQMLAEVWKEHCFPSSWREAIVIPILKPGKVATDPLSYRPIALTSCFCKTFERMVNTRLVKRNLHPDPSIHIGNIQIPVVSAVRFLGVIFDSKLFFLPYVLYLRKKCERSLNILKVLSITLWGADRVSLLRVYQELILSRLDYGCVVYGSALASVLKRLDTVHHSALRICSLSGAFRTSPVTSLYVVCLQPPLELRRRQLSANYFIRAMSIPSHPLKPFALAIGLNRLYDARSFNIKPFSERTKAVLNDAHLNNINIQENNILAFPPWDIQIFNYHNPFSGYDKAGTAAVIYQQLFSFHRSKYSKYIPVYTDGSKSAGHVGCGVVFNNTILSFSLHNSMCL